jgi:hypothetical protein
LESFLGNVIRELERKLETTRKENERYRQRLAWVLNPIQLEMYSLVKGYVKRSFREKVEGRTSNLSP